jgi:hypothetical protein
MSTGRFPFGILPKYPGMKPEDIAVWERFVAKNPAYFDTCDYHVHVGEGAETNPEHPEEIQRDHTALTQKKIDVVGYRGKLPTIVEVKPVANMRALGQMLVYERLYLDDHPELVSVPLIVVCGAVERDTDALFFEHMIALEIA